MAIQNTAQWWIRTDGDDTNGGGYDSGISGAGTNYSDQALPQLSRTDFATSGVGSTTLTSGGGFTSDMIGNSIRLSAGTNLTLGDYFITAYTSSTEVTLDRAPDNGGGGVSGATGKLGGAWRQLELTCTNAATPCPNPTVAGNVINMRGDGSMNPTTQHYSFSYFRTFTAGNTAANGGYMTLRGYNGLAHIGTSPGQWIWHHQGTTFWNFEYIKLSGNGNGNNNWGLMEAQYGTAYRCIFNSNGYGGIGCKANAVECLFDWRSSGPVGFPAFAERNFAYSSENCVFLGHSGGSVPAAELNSMGHSHGCLFVDCQTGIGLLGTNASYMESATRNTIVNATDAGIRVYGEIAEGRSLHYNLVANSAVGIKLNSGTSPQRVAWRKNAFYNNTLNYDGIPAGPEDIYLGTDPFVDAANGNYAINSSSGIHGIDVYAGVPGYSNDTSNFLTIGAVQTNLPDTDTRFEDVQDGDSFYPFRHLVADDFYEDPPAEGTSDDFIPVDARNDNPYYQFEIGSADGRDYADLAEFAADFDNTLIDQPFSKVVVVCHNDTGQNEAVLLTTGLTITSPTNVVSLVITVADDSWHKGEFGKGCVIRASGNYGSLLNFSMTTGELLLERLVIDGDSQSIDNSAHTLVDLYYAPLNATYVRDLIVRGTDGSYATGREINGIRHGRNAFASIENCIVYNLLSTNSFNTNSRPIGINATGYTRVNNCIVYNVDYSTSNLTPAGYGIYASANPVFSYSGVYNCISMEAASQVLAVSSPSINNVITDDSTGDVQSSAAVEFLDAANGDFRLRSGSIAAGSGPQLSSNCLMRDITGKLRSNVSGVTTDAGPFNNIAGYDQEVRFPTEEENAEEASTYVDGEGTRLHPFRQFAEGRIFGTNPTHPLRSS